MGSELARVAQPTSTLDVLRSNRLDRVTRRSIAAIEGKTVVAKAVEDANAAVVRRRMGNAFELGELTALRWTGLHLLVSKLSHEEMPQLESGLRNMEALIGLGATESIMDYLRG